MGTRRETSKGLWCKIQKTLVPVDRMGEDHLGKKEECKKHPHILSQISKNSGLLPEAIKVKQHLVVQKNVLWPSGPVRRADYENGKRGQAVCEHGFHKAKKDAEVWSTQN